MRPDKLTVGDLLPTDSQVWPQSWDLRVLTKSALFSPGSRLSEPATVHPTGYREGVYYRGDMVERKDYMCGGVSGSQRGGDQQGRGTVCTPGPAVVSRRPITAAFGKLRQED